MQYVLKRGRGASRSWAVKQRVVYYPGTPARRADAPTSEVCARAARLLPSPTMCHRRSITIGTASCKGFYACFFEWDQPPRYISKCSSADSQSQWPHSQRCPCTLPENQGFTFTLVLTHGLCESDICLRRNVTRISQRPLWLLSRICMISRWKGNRPLPPNFPLHGSTIFLTSHVA